MGLDFRVIIIVRKMTVECPLLAYSVEKLRSKQNRLVFAEYSRTRDIQNLG